jgi:hypothetical protein
LCGGVERGFSCIASLTCKLAADQLLSRRAERVETGWLQRVGIVSASAVIAVAVLGASDVAFVVTYWGYMVAAYVANGMPHYQPFNEPGHVLIGAVLGGIVALRTASRVSRLLRIRGATAATVAPMGREPDELVTATETGTGRV